FLHGWRKGSDLESQRGIRSHLDGLDSGSETGVPESELVESSSDGQAGLAVTSGRSAVVAQANIRALDRLTGIGRDRLNQHPVIRPGHCPEVQRGGRSAVSRRVGGCA